MDYEKGYAGLEGVHNKGLTGGLNCRESGRAGESPWVVAATPAWPSQPYSCNFYTPPLLDFIGWS